MPPKLNAEYNEMLYTPVPSVTLHSLQLLKFTDQVEQSRRTTQRHHRIPSKTDRFLLRRNLSVKTHPELARRHLPSASRDVVRDISVRRRGWH